MLTADMAPKHRLLFSLAPTRCLGRGGTWSPSRRPSVRNAELPSESTPSAWADARARDFEEATIYVIREDSNDKIINGNRTSRSRAKEFEVKVKKTTTVKDIKLEVSRPSLILNFADAHRSVPSLPSARSLNDSITPISSSTLRRPSSLSVSWRMTDYDSKWRTK